MHNPLRYPLFSMPPGGIDPGSVNHASVPTLPSQSQSQSPVAKSAHRQVEVMPHVETKVSQQEANSTDHAGTAIDSKAVCDRDAQHVTGQSLPSIKLNQKELKETQGQLLEQADELLKKSNENKAVTASLGGLKQSVAELKKAQNDSPEEALKAMKNTAFPPELNVKITLKSGEKFSLIPPGDALVNQPNLGQLMEKAVAILEKHHDENFASFDQDTNDRELTSLKQQVSGIDQQLGKEATGANDFARLENRQCLLTINVRSRVEDGSVKATHIDGGPIAQQQTVGSPLAGPGYTGTTDQLSHTQTEVELGNDRPETSEPTAQDPEDPSPADKDISINSPDAGGDTDLLDDLKIEVAFENPDMGGFGQGASLIPGIVKSPSDTPSSTPGTGSQPDGIQQVGDNSEDYGELDGVAELFTEPEGSGESAALDSQETDVITTARSGDEVPIGSSSSIPGADQSETESIQTEVKSAETISAGEDSPSLAVADTGLDDFVQSETALERSGESEGFSQDSIPEGTAFTADSTGSLDSSASSDSDYFSEGEGDQSTTQTLKPETGAPTSVTEESSSMDKAEVVRKETANIGDIAKRRMKEKLQTDSIPASTTRTSPASNPKPKVTNKPVDLSQVKSTIPPQTRPAKSSAAAAPKSKVTNKPVDVSHVKSTIPPQTRAARKSAAPASKPKVTNQPVDVSHVKSTIPAQTRPTKNSAAAAPKSKVVNKPVDVSNVKSTIPPQIRPAKSSAASAPKAKVANKPVDLSNVKSTIPPQTRAARKSAAPASKPKVTNQPVDVSHVKSTIPAQTRPTKNSAAAAPKSKVVNKPVDVSNVKSTIPPQIRPAKSSAASAPKAKVANKPVDLSNVKSTIPPQTGTTKKSAASAPKIKPAMTDKPKEMSGVKSDVSSQEKNLVGPESTDTTSKDVGDSDKE